MGEPGFQKVEDSRGLKALCLAADIGRECLCACPRLSGVYLRGGSGTLTTGRAGAVDRGHPQVSRARVKDDLELLRRGSNADGANIGQLPGPERNDWGVTFPGHPQAPGCLPLSGCPMSPEITFQPPYLTAAAQASAFI